MDIYIGTKIVQAEPMRESTFLIDYRNYRPDAIAGPSFTKEGYKVVYEDGYTSWSPKETFERAYRKVSDKETQLILQAIPAAQLYEIYQELI